MTLATTVDFSGRGGVVFLFEYRYYRYCSVQCTYYMDMKNTSKAHYIEKLRFINGVVDFLMI